MCRVGSPDSGRASGGIGRRSPSTSCCSRAGDAADVRRTGWLPQFTSGWYIWAGEQLSDDPDFFVPLHVEHLAMSCPAAIPYLALPPGWRFLVAPGYEDVWPDQSLLQV